MNMKKLFALVLSLVFICSSFLVVSAEAPAAGSVTVKVAVTEEGLAFEAIVASDVASVTFTQNAEAVEVTEYATVGKNNVFAYNTADAADVTVTVGEATLDVQTARFDGEVGTKYAVYTALTAGNVNADAATDIKDVVRIKKIVAKAADEIAAADIDGVDGVTVTDLVLLAKYIVTAKKGIAINTVTFKNDNGSVLSTVEVPTGFKVVPTYVPTKNAAGYDFDGWDTSLAGITEDTVITAVYNSNISGTVPDDWEYDEVQP